MDYKLYDESKIDKELMGIDLPMLFAIYLYQHKDKSQAMIAEEMGMSPVKLSRIINSGKPADLTMYPELMKMLLDVDFGTFSEKYHVLADLQSRINEEKYLSYLRSCTINYFKQAHPSFEPVPPKEGSEALITFCDHVTMNKWNIYCSKNIDFTQFLYLQGARVSPERPVRGDDSSYLFDSQSAANKFLFLANGVENGNTSRVKWGISVLILAHDGSVDEYYFNTLPSEKLAQL